MWFEERVANDISCKYHGRPNVIFFFFLLFFTASRGGISLSGTVISQWANKSQRHERDTFFLFFLFFKDLSKETDDVVPRPNFSTSSSTRVSELERSEMNHEASRVLAVVGFDFARSQLKKRYTRPRVTFADIYLSKRGTRGRGKRAWTPGYETITRHILCVSKLYI